MKIFNLLFGALILLTVLLASCNIDSSKKDNIHYKPSALSSEAINSYITLNDELNLNCDLVRESTLNTYKLIDIQNLTLKFDGRDMSRFKYWQEKLHLTSIETRKLTSLLLNESNKLIKKTNDKDWREKQDYDGYLIELKPFNTLNKLDDTDVVTDMFVGKDPMRPNVYGFSLKDSILSFRDLVTYEMGTYSANGEDFYFYPPSHINGLEKALKNTNPTDHEIIRKVYEALTLPELVKIESENKTLEIPWSTAMFHKKPLIAVLTKFTGLKLRLLNAENLVSFYFKEKLKNEYFD